MGKLVRDLAESGGGDAWKMFEPLGSLIEDRTSLIELGLPHALADHGALHLHGLASEYEQWLGGQISSLNFAKTIAESGKQRRVPPQFLYKYRRLSNPDELRWAKDLICERALYLAPRSNDDLDFLAPFETIHGERHFPMETGTPKTTSEALQEVSKILTGTWVGMFCLSDDPLREHLWSEYARPGGLCVKIASGQILKDFVIDGTQRFLLREIQYEEQRKPIRMNASQETRLKDVLYSFFQKEIRWKDEREWRFLRHSIQEMETLTPEKRRVVLSQGGIAGVYLGWDMSPENKRDVTSWCEPLGIPMFPVIKEPTTGALAVAVHRDSI
jgi:hypothetical protein